MVKSFMGSKIWGYINNILYCSFGLYCFFFFSEKQLFFFQYSLGIIRSEFQFCYMKKLMFCLKQHSIKGPIY